MILTILDQLANEPSSNKKLAILKKNANNELLKNVFRLAYNKSITFGIKKIPDMFDPSHPSMTLEECMIVLENDYATRKVTGNTAIEFMAHMITNLSYNDSIVLERIVDRDLRCGASGSSANKVWKNLIPSQPVMLSESFKEKNIANIRYPAFAQLKSDGSRCMIIKQDGVVTMWSRNGKELLGIEPILDEVKAAPYDNVVIDGELVVVDLFDRVLPRQIGNGVVSKAQKGTITSSEASMVRLQAWDSIPVDDYWAGKCEMGYQLRLNSLKTIVSLYHKRISVIPTHVVNSREEANKVYEEYIDQGLEGIILKNTNHIWVDKRSKDCVKFKQVIDFDARIVGYYVHEKDPTKLGGIIIESECGLIRNNCGSGFKDKKADGHELDRTLLWENRDSLINMIAELECNGCLSRKKVKDGEAPFKLFLPIIKALRWDKDVANTKDEIF